MGTNTHRLTLLLLFLAAGCAHPVAEPAPPAPSGPHLLARAVLPADTFAPGPPCGRVLVPSELRGRTRPFPSQPVQGFSALLPDGPGRFLALSDNGFGAPESSADYRLRIYRVKADFAAGRLVPGDFIELSDPNRQLPFTLVNEFTDAGRPLTGADLDPESFQPDGDGGFWVGDELGPFLVHVDGEGRVLEPPVSLPDLFSPYHPRYEEAAVLRTAQALAAHALANGAVPPVISPSHLLVADSDPATGVPDRLDAGVSSELFDVAALRKAGFDVVPWTVNDAARAARLTELGVAGVISDRPDLLLDAGIPNVQGHRGARGLQPENTLPAFRAALSVGVQTLEADVLLTKDGVPVIGHDPVLSVEKCRIKKARVVRELTAAEVAKTICDRTLLGQPLQRVTPGASYAMPTLEQLLQLPAPRFSIEVKTEPEQLTDAIVAVVKRLGLEERVDIQSFDLSALLRVHRIAPRIRTVALFADLPQLNLQPDASGKSPLLAGLGWPYRQTHQGVRPRVAVSGGFEAMARAVDGTLWPMLEKPLVGGPRTLHACAFDPGARRYTGRCFEYPLHARAVAATDFQLTGLNEGVVLERDDTQGDVNGFKRVFTVTLEPLAKRERVDLMALRSSLALEKEPGDVGLGPHFSFPFWTIESALPVGHQLVVVNDNNYPFSCGRHVGSGAPDDTELIVIEP